ncbi:MAG: hypothetical protein NUV45_15240 [Tepidanaerobacteraceae bacterium]|jgi:CRISPR-associated protein Cmr2|nr:hypothetical protein [Tepidanaerobacteraceae bacterium]
MPYEVILTDLKKPVGNNGIYHFLKYAQKYVGCSECGKQLKYVDSSRLQVLFPFAKEVFVNSREFKDYKNIRVENLPLEWFKSTLMKDTDGSRKVQQNKANQDAAGYHWKINKESLELMHRLCGIYKTRDEMAEAVKKLVPGSFGIGFEFTLQAPYFSRDDEDFYVVQNPVMKEKVWKVPMLRASSIKGQLFAAAKEAFWEAVENGDADEVLETFFGIYRIFGSGSDEFRKVEKIIDEYIKEKCEEKVLSSLIKYAFSELSANLRIEARSDKSYAQQIFDYIKEQNQQKTGFGSHRGRVIFYPIFFDRLSLEIINPHKRKTKVGKGPIYFEVVPKGAKGFLQMIYVPHDALMSLKKADLCEEAKKDCIFLEKWVKRLLMQHGIGAKNKYGWGLCRIDSHFNTLQDWR